VSDAYKRFRLGRGVNELARIFVDPDALPELKTILDAPPASQRAIDSAVRLLTRSYIGTQPPPLELTLTTPRGKALASKPAISSPPNWLFNCVRFSARLLRDQHQEAH
jgi:hypothetical protein